ncbi:zinc finger protein 34-like isoform X1 [Papio anubis]|uniref:zinc finger protein 34-like isoform X1 n=1 Tax=Papio anubis TaxID=9555 RepID=UPI0012AD889E|nr:zinc finger protein 34-like isoform X1 [Papio anubis]
MSWSDWWPLAPGFPMGTGAGGQGKLSGGSHFWSLPETIHQYEVNSRRRSPAMVAEPQGTVMFEEVAMYLTQEEGQHLGPPQRAPHQDVMLENHCTLTALDKHHMVFQCPHSGLFPSGSRGKCHGSLLCQGLPAQVSEEILTSRQSINNQPQQKNLKNNYKE